MPFSVTPAKAGIQERQKVLDPGFRRGDGLEDFSLDPQDRAIGTREFRKEQ